jgi:hypothetical protein
MATVTVKHHPSGGPADPSALVDGPAYDNDPHIVEGLDQVDNTSDVNKPVSSAQAAAIAAVVASIRAELTADTTFYVSSAGSDSNNGLSSGAPFLTLQHAYNAISSGYDDRGFLVTLRLLDGTYTGALVVDGWRGVQPFAIAGNIATPANVIINTGAANAITATNAYLTVNGVTLQTSGGFGQLVAGAGGDISFSNVQFAGTTGQHITAIPGRVHATGSYSIVGGGQSHWHAHLDGLIEVLNNAVITTVGTPAFSSYFAGASYGGNIQVSAGVTFAGSGATGQKWLVHNLGAINSGGLGVSGFPGNAPGQFFDTWGLYDGIFSGVNGLSGGAPLPADTYFTGNSNTVASAALSFAAQFHSVGANGSFAGYASDAYGAGVNLDTARLAFGTATAPTAVNGAAYIKTFIGQALDSTGAYGNVAALDLAAANSQTGTNHGGFMAGRVTPPGSTTPAEVWRASAGFMIGNMTDPGTGNLSVSGGAQVGSFTVATLPTGATGKTVWASNCRVFNGAGTQEGASSGTGGFVTYNGTAWKIAGTNVTAIA